MTPRPTPPRPPAPPRPASKLPACAATRPAGALAAAACALALVPAALLAAAGPARADAAADPTTLPLCTDVATAYGDYAQHSLSAGITGVPDAVVAGDGWHAFTATVTGIGDRTVPLVAVQALAWRETDGDTPLGPYAEVEAADAAGGWQPLSGGSYGYAAPVRDLAPGRTASCRFRFRISADAPADVRTGEMSVEYDFADTYQHAGSTQVTDCAGRAIADHGYRVRPAGDAVPPTGAQTPTPTHSAPATTPAPKTPPTPGTPGTPAAGANAGPAASAGPALAATGASSTLPLLAGLGAAALLAGAATVTAGRRRTRTRR